MAKHRIAGASRPGIVHPADRLHPGLAPPDCLPAQRRTITPRETRGPLAMAAESPQGLERLAPLADRLPEAADARQVADVVVALWLEIDQALHPIIGHRGVAALYNRSLSLTAAAHPWMGACLQDVLGTVDPSLLKQALLQQAAADALGAGNALFGSFQALLASLVGPSLTDRLLRPVWLLPTGASPAQDNPS